ncbi:hypothetical protein ILYODFUR_004062 [Ilyodon furcidens]|uniref:Uncharacterized protein n=1 Tax=Ilyodon furcidens TaxID=33524 RepID=A0ABV0TRR3_9TELE
MEVHFEPAGPRFSFSSAHFGGPKTKTSSCFYVDDDAFFVVQLVFNYLELPGLLFNVRNILLAVLWVRKLCGSSNLFCCCVSLVLPCWLLFKGTFNHKSKYLGEFDFLTGFRIKTDATCCFRQRFICIQA